MPTSQIISMESDGGVNAASEAVARMKQSIQGAQKLKLLKMQYQNEARQTDNEARKIELKQNEDIVTYVENLKKHGIKSPKAMEIGYNLWGKKFFDISAAVGDILQEDDPNIEKTKAETKKIKADMDPALRSAMMEADISALRSLSGNGLPPGTTYGLRTAGGGLMNIPLNPNLTAQEADSVAATKNTLDVHPQVDAAIDKGIFGKNPADRFIKQALIQSPTAIATSADPKLGNFRTLYNVIRRASLFDEAGKALTGTEEAEQLRLLELTGKTDSQIKQDLGYLIKKNKHKMDLILGGTNAAGARSSVIGAPPAPAVKTLTLPSGKTIQIKGQ